MSQYLSDNSQRFYQPNYDYSVPQNNFIFPPSQRNPSVRESSLNRNNSVSCSLVLKPGKIQENVGGKIRRENSMRNSVDFKENDPSAKNSHLSASINNTPFTVRDQNDYISEYDSKNSYCNPLIVKREKISKDLSRQKIPNHHQARQNLTQSLKSSSNSKPSLYQQQYEFLSEKFLKLELQMKDNCSSIAQHKNKIQKLEEYYQTEASKEEKSRKHSRSISNPNSGTPNFKQLSDIMSLIEETKNYQIKNSQEYRKMIEEFRSTILEFRQELNKTAKKNDIDLEIQKLKHALNGDTHITFSRKSSSDYSGPHAFLTKSKESETIEKMERQISLMRVSIEKLEEQSTSIKADMVKLSVRDKKMSEEINLSIGEMNRKLQNFQKQVVPFSQNYTKRGSKYDGISICFKVSEQVTTNLSESRKGLRASHMTHSSVVEYEEGSKLALPNRQCLTVNEKTYFIDKDGYLLDKDNYYLLNDRNEQIKLSLKQIETLKRLKVLQ